MRFAALLSCFALLGCAETSGGAGTTTTAPAEPAAFRSITTVDEFNSLVVGKRLTYEGVNYFTVRADGTLDGDFGGPLVGNWRWEAGYWCRTLITPNRPEDCQLWETDGTALRATRAKGTGPSFLYAM